MSAAIPLISSDGMKSPSEQYPDDPDLERYEYSEGSQSPVLTRIGTTRRLYILAALLVFLGAGLDALRGAFLSTKTSGNPLNLDMTKLAVMIEKRNMSVLIPVLHNFISNVPQDYPFQLWTSQETAAVVRASTRIGPHVESGKLKLMMLPNNGDDLYDGNTLSKLMTDTWWWDQLGGEGEAEHMLFFQTDSILCSRSEFTADDFLGLNDTRTEGKGYALVGAAWPWEGYPRIPSGGNGGLSIRRRSIMRHIASLEDRRDGLNEDGYYVDALRKYYGTDLFPEQPLAMRFSFENKPNNAPDDDWVFQPHGIHIGSYWFVCANREWEQIRRLREWCPEISMIISPDCVPHGDQHKED